LEDPTRGTSARSGNASWKSCGCKREVRQGGGKDPFQFRDLFAAERFSRPVLDFLCTPDVERLVPGPAEEDAQSEASEWELRDRDGR